MKYAANLLSGIRILLSPVLLFVQDNASVFFTFYILCGLTDALDGFVARKTHTATKFGAKLDTVGDLLFTTVLVVYFLNTISVTKLMILWMAVIFAGKLFSIGIGFARHGAFSPIHSYLNKAAGMAIFLLPVALLFLPEQMVIYVVLSIASVAALEEILIVALQTSYDANCKALVCLKKS